MNATAELRFNFRHLYADIFWFGVLTGSTMAFLAIYIARLGANGFMVGLLTAGPAVVNLLFSLPAGRWLEGRPLIAASFWSALLHRLGYLAIIPLPWLLAPFLEMWAVILITVLMSVPGTLLAIGFNAMFADVVPPDLRSEVVGKRNAIMAVSITLTTLLCGQLLDRIIFPLNYQIVFALGAMGAMLSTYHMGRVKLGSEKISRRIGRPLGDRARPGLQRFGDAIRLAVGLRFLTRSHGRPLLRLDLLGTAFGPFLASYLFFYACQFLPVSLYPLAFVRVLDLSDGAISLGNALFYTAMLIVSLRSIAFSARFGHKRLLVVGALAYGFYPLLIGLARDATLYWVASLEGGMAWGVASGAIINHLMNKVPDEDRPAYMALHNLALNIGILSGSLLGPVLGDWLGTPPALVIIGLLRTLAGCLLLVWA